nr:carbon-nitrogen hydrolase family protein [Burkholderia sp. S171]
MGHTVRVAAAQAHDFREEVDAALLCLRESTASAENDGVSLLCFPEGFLQGYLTEETVARRNAFDLASSAFQAILAQFPRTGPMIVLGLIEKDGERLFNTAVVIKGGALVGRYRKAHLLRRGEFLKPDSMRPSLRRTVCVLASTFATTPTFPKLHGRLRTSAHP